MRLRDIAARVEITERADQRVVQELLREGYIETERVGRRHRYRVNAGRPCGTRWRPTAPWAR